MDASVITSEFYWCGQCHRRCCSLDNCKSIKTKHTALRVNGSLYPNTAFKILPSVSESPKDYSELTSSDKDAIL